MIFLYYKRLVHKNKVKQSVCIQTKQQFSRTTETGGEGGGGERRRCDRTCVFVISEDVFR